MPTSPHPCEGCGKPVSANKRKCLKCIDAEIAQLYERRLSAPTETPKLAVTEAAKQG